MDSDVSPPGRRLGLPDAAVFLVFAVLFLTQCVVSLRGDSATFDETYHVTAGYLHLRYGDYAYNAMHPPLVKMLAAVPLLFMRDLHMPPDDATELGFQFLYLVNDADRLLFWSRVALLPLGLLLGAALYAWTRELAGRPAAAVALLLCAFEPNILAHAHLVNTDFGVTVFMFLAVFTLYRLVRLVSIGRMAAAGLALGCALLSKLSALVLLALVVLLPAAEWLSRRRLRVRLPGLRNGQARTRRLKAAVLGLALLAVGLVAYVVIWAGYRFTFETRVLYPQAMAPFTIGMSPGHTPIQWSLWALKRAHLLPEAFLEGVGQALGAAERTSYVAGVVGRGQWNYFFVTFGLKNTLAFLALLLLVPVAVRRLWTSHRLAVPFLVVPVVLYFAVAVVTRLNIGHRHVLPVYPFLFVLVGAAVPWVLARRRWVQAIVGLLLLWHVGESVWIAPHYLAYFNELAGGPNRGHRYLLDSNIDWGQDLKRLKRYMDEHGIRRIWLSYFGTASPDYYGIRYNYLPSHAPIGPKTDQEPTPWVAISVTDLYGAYLPDVILGGKPTPRDTFRAFWHRRPVAKIGYSIFVYRLDQ